MMGANFVSLLTTVEFELAVLVFSREMREERGDLEELMVVSDLSELAKFLKVLPLFSVSSSGMYLISSVSLAVPRAERMSSEFICASSLCDLGVRSDMVLSVGTGSAVILVGVLKSFVYRVFKSVTTCSFVTRVSSGGSCMCGGLKRELHFFVSF